MVHIILLQRRDARANHSHRPASESRGEDECSGVSILEMTHGKLGEQMTRGATCQTRREICVAQGKCGNGGTQQSLLTNALWKTCSIASMQAHTFSSSASPMANSADHGGTSAGPRSAAQPPRAWRIPVSRSTPAGVADAVPAVLRAPTCTRTVRVRNLRPAAVGLVIGARGLAPILQPTN